MVGCGNDYKNRIQENNPRKEKDSIRNWAVRETTQQEQKTDRAENQRIDQL